MLATSFTVRMFDVFSMFPSELYGVRWAIRDWVLLERPPRVRHSRGAFWVSETICGPHRFIVRYPAPRMPNSRPVEVPDFFGIYGALLTRFFGILGADRRHSGGT